MISLKDAYEKAKTENIGLVLVSCVDIGTAWAFYFSPDEKEATGGSYTTIKKSTGNIGFLTIPPIENLKRLQKGQKIPIKSIID